jgi:hypothetical protein
VSWERKLVPSAWNIPMLNERKHVGYGHSWEMFPPRDKGVNLQRQ